MVAGLNAGGTERVVSTLANFWASRGLRVQLFVLATPHEPFFPLDSRIEIKYVPGRNTLGVAQRILGKISQLKELRSNFTSDPGAPIFSFLPHVNVLTILASYRLRRRVIVCERNLIQRQDLSVIWRVLRVAVYWKADAVSVNRSDNLTVLRRFVSGSRLLTLPNPVSLPAYDVLPQENREKLIVAVGRLTFQKGFDILIEAAAFLDSLERGWRLEIWGSGIEEANLEKLILKRRLSGKVKICSPSPHLPSVLRAASIFVMPSRFEGLPNSLLEALSVGLPVIVSRHCGDLVEDIASVSQRLVAPDDQPETWATAIERLIDGEDLRLELSSRLSEIVTPYRVGNAIKAWNNIAHLS